MRGKNFLQRGSTLVRGLITLRVHVPVDETSCLIHISESQETLVNRWMGQFVKSVVVGDDRQNPAALSCQDCDTQEDPHIHREEPRRIGDSHDELAQTFGERDLYAVAQRLSGTAPSVKPLRYLNHDDVIRFCFHGGHIRLCIPADAGRGNSGDDRAGPMICKV